MADVAGRKTPPESVPQLLPPWKKRFFIFVMFAIAAALSVATSEIVLRVYEDARLPERLVLFRPNPHGTGSYRLRPNLDLRTKLQGREITIGTNSAGMRWREVAAGVHAKTTRIAFVGDSFTFGCWADSVEESFVGVFESVLRPLGIEALNFGVGGYGLGDIELLIREELLRYHPDYIVLAFFNGNDIRDTFLGIDKYEVSRGFAEFDKENLLEKVGHAPGESQSPGKQEKTMLSRLGGVLKNYSALYRFLAPNQKEGDLGEFRVSPSFMDYSYWSNNPYPPLALKAKDYTLGILARINEVSVKNGIKLAIVAVPFKEQVLSSEEQGAGYDIRDPQRSIGNFARNHSIPYLDLLPLLRKETKVEKGALYIPGDPHFNNTGHRVAGELMAAWFRTLLDSGVESSALDAGEAVNGGRGRAVIPRFPPPEARFH